MHSIFPVMAVDRVAVHWEDHLFEPTPYEEHAGVWFKREDYFAPLGYGGPNGSKMRQLIWLVNRGRAGKTRLVSGASVKSPQLSMSTIVAEHYGLDTELIIGATNPVSAARHQNVQIAARFGAKFRIVNVAYNPYLQSKVREFAGDDSVTVEYGITLDHVKNTPSDIVSFHELGANQVKGMPAVDTLIVPAGSCNTLVSVLYGIAKHRPRINTLYTLGIGPDKLKWVHDRLRIIEKATGEDIIPLFSRVWPQYAEQAAAYPTASPAYRWVHHNLNAAGFSTYQQEMPESWGEIDFHPTYEGKMMRYLLTTEGLATDGAVCFWIVGSQPQPEVIASFSGRPRQQEITCLA